MLSACYVPLHYSFETMDTIVGNQHIFCNMLTCLATAQHMIFDVQECRTLLTCCNLC